MNNLPRVVARIVLWQESNLLPLDHKSSALTTTPPSHLVYRVHEVARHAARSTVHVTVCWLSVESPARRLSVQRHATVCWLTGVQWQVTVCWLSVESPAHRLCICQHNLQLSTITEQRTESERKYLGSAHISSCHIGRIYRCSHPLDGYRTMCITDLRALHC